MYDVNIGSVRSTSQALPNQVPVDMLISAGTDYNSAISPQYANFGKEMNMINPQNLPLLELYGQTSNMATQKSNIPEYLGDGVQNPMDIVFDSKELGVWMSDSNMQSLMNDSFNLSSLEVALQDSAEFMAPC